MSTELFNQKMQEMLCEMHEKVAEFLQDIIDLPVPDEPTCLSNERLKYAVDHLQEELNEFANASQRKDITEAADGLIDLIYVALGRLIEMGVPAQTAFTVVHDANMKKERGEKKGRQAQGFDAIKPKDWEPPDYSWLLFATIEDMVVSGKKQKLEVEGGHKADLGKAPLSMIPFAALIEEALVFEYGAKKYGKNNWEKGIKWSRYIDAALRHIYAFASGEDLDDESGFSHLAHARCCLSILTGLRLRSDLDNRKD